jgi:signal transduction histidine kinase
VAIVRHRLFDIELVLRRSIVYTVLTASVVAAYGASLAATARLLDAYADVGASLVASAVVAVGLSPVKERLDGAVDRALFGDRRRPDRALAALGSRLQDVAAGTAVLPMAVQTVREVLRLPYVAIEVDGREGPLASAGEPRTDALALDLVSHGIREGRLLVAPRGPGDAFDEAELRLLDDLCRQVALVVRSSRLTDDLRRSRERLVLAREQERLRLRRDLHDGLGPVLAGLTLQADALREHLDPDSAVGADLLDRIKRELRRCMSDVRRAVDGLRPADLDQLGLPGVIAEQARSLSASGVAVEMDCDPDLIVSSPAAEVAAYRIVTEALTNVVRHSGARRCRVVLQAEEHTLRLEVSDDGRGLGDDPRDGVGLASMRERASELGGHLRIEPGTDGGTRVHARIPLAVVA